jgi:hypothetical protein
MAILPATDTKTSFSHRSDLNLSLIVSAECSDRPALARDPSQVDVGIRRGYAETSRRRHKHRQYNVLIETLLCDLTCSPSVDFNLVLQQALRKMGAIECLHILDEAGMQVTETACRPTQVFARNRSMFRPAAVGTDHSLKEYYYMLLDAELPKYTTDPYVSLATGNLCQTISTCFRDGFNNRLYVLCVDVKVT